MLTWDRVLAAIGFNGQPRLNRGEIDKIGRNLKLTAKSEAQMASAQETPEPALGVGWGPPQRPRAFCGGAAASHRTQFRRQKALLIRTARLYSPITAR